MNIPLDQILFGVSNQVNVIKGISGDVILNDGVIDRGMNVQVMDISVSVGEVQSGYLLSRVRVVFISSSNIIDLKMIIFSFLMIKEVENFNLLLESQISFELLRISQRVDFSSLSLNAEFKF